MNSTDDARRFDAAVASSGRMTTIPVAELQNPVLRDNRLRGQASARARVRAAWWYPIAAVLVVASALYAGLRFDQQVAAVLIWPTEGASFVEVGGSFGDIEYRRSLVIVAGGLNRKSGTLVADALQPSLGGADTRVFSLIYGDGISDDDVNAKFDALFRQLQPRQLILVGSSMGGDVVLNIAAHFQRTFADSSRYLSPSSAPRLEAVYLDCTPLGTADVRLAARAQADLLTGLTEHLGTARGAGARLVTEMLATEKQWSYGDFPFITLKPHDFAFKWAEVWREKLATSGVSTRLVREQYGVIRRFDGDRTFEALGKGANVVFLRPVDALADTTIDVQQVEDRLRVLAAADRLDLTVLEVPGGSHASAARDAAVYNPLLLGYRAALNDEQAFFVFR